MTVQLQPVRYKMMPVTEKSERPIVSMPGIFMSLTFGPDPMYYSIRHVIPIRFGNLPKRNPREIFYISDKSTAFHGNRCHNRFPGIKY